LLGAGTSPPCLIASALLVASAIESSCAFFANPPTAPAHRLYRRTRTEVTASGRGARPLVHRLWWPERKVDVCQFTPPERKNDSRLSHRGGSVIRDRELTKMSLRQNAPAAEAAAVPHSRWMLWKRNRYTKAEAAIGSAARAPHRPTSWFRRLGQAMGAVLGFLALRPLKAVAGGGGFGAGASKANMPPLERCVFHFCFCKRSVLQLIGCGVSGTSDSH
jgi:hypothetical protein